VLTIGTRLDSVRPHDPGNYRLFAKGRPERAIRIKKAVYDPATGTVTLRPLHRLNLHNLFRLTVIETGQSGVTDIAGNPLNGQNNRDPVSNFVIIVRAADLVLTTTDPAIVRAYQKILAEQTAHLRATVSDHRVSRPV
jgi:hypothetical protein